MGNFLSIPILAIAAALQAGFVFQIRLLGGGPDLVFLLVIAWSINSEIEEAVVWAFVGGICVDLLSAAPTGASVFGLLIMVFAVSGIGRQVYRIGIIVMAGLVLVGTIIHQIMFMIIITLAGYKVVWLTDLAYIVAPTALYNLLLIWPTYWFVRRLQRRVRGRPQSSPS